MNVLMQRPRWYKRLADSRQLYVCLLPALTYIFIFQYVPMYGLQIAFQNYMPGLGFSDSPWVGLHHFSTFIHSVQFPMLVRNTVLISVYSLVFGFPVPILLALMLNEVRSQRFKRLIQNATYMPYFISCVVVVAMLINFTSPTIGLVNKLRGLFKLAPIDFMSKQRWFRSLYILSGIWQSAGWNAIIYTAALAGIDPQMIEAAQIDGAGRLRRIWHIYLPGLAPTAIMLFILNCGSIMNVGFEKVFLMQNSLNMSVSQVISTYVYSLGLLSSKFSYTSAIGLFNTLINFALLLIVNMIARKFSETSIF